MSLHLLVTLARRSLACMLAKKYNKKFPASWEGNKKAGEVWLKQRQPILFLRLPQATSKYQCWFFCNRNMEKPIFCLIFTDRILPYPEMKQSLSVPYITENPEGRTPSPNPSIGIAENGEIAMRECNVGARTLTPKLLTVQNMTSSSSPSILSNNAEESVASISTAHSPLATTSNVFSPELFGPLPNAPPRKRNQPNRRKTPTKDEIAAIEASRKIKDVKRRVLSEKKKKPNKN
ncbi:hypothetical protein JTB14_004212 [Gonioctena quinquepunctata]|nr:hypothetical protein JTB14_004212 [Gonioctena quinquepunctata]